MKRATCTPQLRLQTRKMAPLSLPLPLPRRPRDTEGLRAGWAGRKGGVGPELVFPGCWRPQDVVGLEAVGAPSSFPRPPILLIYVGTINGYK